MWHLEDLLNVSTGGSLGGPAVPNRRVQLWRQSHWRAGQTNPGDPSQEILQQKCHRRLVLQFRWSRWVESSTLRDVHSLSAARRICLPCFGLLFLLHFFLLSSGDYSVPADGHHEDYLMHIEGLPRDAPPNVFGMNTNASISKERNETDKLFASVLLTQAS